MLAFRPISEIIRLHEELDRELRSDPAVRDIHRLYDSLAAKLASLFQHQSIMIAVCTFLANLFGTNHYVKAAYLLETLSYMVLCLIMLPALYISAYDFPPDTSDRKVYFAKSIRRRANLLVVSLSATTCLTMLVIFTLSVDLYNFWSRQF
jgi:hypothetical protein